MCNAVYYIITVISRRKVYLFILIWIFVFNRTLPNTLSKPLDAFTHNAVRKLEKLHQDDTWSPIRIILLDTENGMLIEKSPKLLPTKPRILTTLKRKAFENIVGKGENAGNQYSLLFPQCFLPYEREKSLFQQHSSLVNAFNLVQSKILLCGK